MTDWLLPRAVEAITLCAFTYIAAFDLGCYYESKRNGLRHDRLTFSDSPTNRVYLARLARGDVWARLRFPALLIWIACLLLLCGQHLR